MRKKISLWIVAALLVTALPLAARQTAEPASGQILAIASSPRMIPPPTLVDYVAALYLAHEAGANGAVATYKWSELEPSPGQFKLDDLINGMNYVETTYGYVELVGVQVLNTTARETPADLESVSFDEPQMLTRFEALFDVLLPHLSHNVRYLSIGNEVDVYLDAHPQEWATYKTFYDQAAAYVRQAAPWLQVGVTVTFGGVQRDSAQVARLTEHSDVFIVTYYPLDSNFGVEDAAAPLRDFPRMVTAAVGRPVVLQEVGYPSADLLGSSEQKQADFVRNVFTAWKAAGSAIPFLGYFVLHDFSDQLCSSLESYYGLQAPRFHAYLCTLGLRQADGTPKLAWSAFLDEAGKWHNGDG